jgi:hypothetical protein
MTKPIIFSEMLQGWLQGKHSKTLQSLTELFAEKAFAIVFLLLMALPALPLPTGGLTHVTEIITLLLSLELIVGRKSIWLPKRWLEINVGKHVTGKAASRLIGIIKWFERWARPRGVDLLQTQIAKSVIGFIVFALTLAAFVAPPFSGLDTLPALGVVTISLGMIFEDLVLLLVGFVIGAVGIGVEIALGAGLYHAVQHLPFL